MKQDEVGTQKNNQKRKVSQVSVEEIRMAIYDIYDIMTFMTFMTFMTLAKKKLKTQHPTDLYFR